MAPQAIVVGVDAYRSSAAAVAWASMEAAARGDELVLVHSVDTADAPLLTGRGALIDEVRDQLAIETLIENRMYAASRHPRLRMTSCLSHATAAEALIEASNDASLLVLGSHGVSGLAESIYGSVAHRVMVHSRCPVVVVPPVRSTHSVRLIVVGLAPTRAGRLALRFALEEAQRHDGAVIGVRAGGDVSGGALDELRRAIDKEFPRIAFDAVASEAEPASAILDAVPQADLIVLGCHHSEDPWSSRLGAVPSSVLHLADVPVALVGQINAT
jgi:nucleotide-binding universal stress UspA family protein